jgi:hypothetical protein
MAAALRQGGDLVRVASLAGITIWVPVSGREGVRLEDEGGSPLAVLAAGGAIRVATDDADVGLVELPPGGVAVAQGGAGALAVGRAGDGHLEYVAVPPPLSAHAPAWLRALHESARHGPFALPSESAGLGLRFDEPADAGGRRAALASLLAGHDPPTRLAVRAWWNSLPEDRQQWEAARVAHRGVQLLELVEELRAVAEDSPGWRSSFQTLCRDRDRVESMRAALAAAGAAEDVEHILEAVDQAAVALVDGIAFSPAFHDTTLAEIQARSLPAWWLRWARRPAG